MQTIILSAFLLVIILALIISQKLEQTFYMEQIQQLINKLMSKDFAQYTQGVVINKSMDNELAKAVEGVDDRHEADLII